MAIPAPVRGRSIEGDALQFALARLAVYYLVIATLMLLVHTFAPGFSGMLVEERARHVGMAGLSGENTYTSDGELLRFGTGIVVLASSMIAMLVALPVARVYGWTTPKKRYSQDFAQSLVLLPLALSTVVFLVKGSLALAFSLAGIVAVVRFRNQLATTRESVFLFAVIGIGLSAGVQLLYVSIISSAVFNAAVIVIRAQDFGRRPQRLAGWSLEDRSKGGSEPDGAALTETLGSQESPGSGPVTS